MSAGKALDRKNYPESVLDRLLASPPILPHENAKAFADLFDEFVKYASPETTRDLLEVFQVTVLNWEILRYCEMKASIMRNNRRAAVERLIRVTHDGAAMKGAEAAVRADSAQKTKQWFADPAHRATMRKTFEAAGYAPNAVEAEAFERALPSLASIERLLASAEKRLAALLKDIEKRSEKRAADLRLAARKATSSSPAGTAG